ncbi:MULTISPECIES: hypothetical protein [Bacteroidaceae]|uniref:Surface protein n=1 Tax=Phocaeicola intestinalis TaxID=2762212 RepID=A0ABR8Y4E6_9BACT|nr:MULTISPECIES: hypothetical protein [Bacteroidaceae]CCZ70975.1 putative surface protein [Bacteroides sp. CAG:702]MBD8039070.1 surface protein [Phocaeicola intestinalis]MBM6945938.1 surface protein [Bacteroides gallinaceum]MDN0065374.1 surface protein [Bacteroides gallinaceum]OUN80179.1 surface protein [Bacteroides sp. An51A]
MRVSASMESLWQYIQSLSLSERNRIWLADKLLEGTRKEEEETEYISKEEILAGIDAGLKDMKAGRTRPAEELLEELRNGL